MITTITTIASQSFDRIRLSHLIAISQLTFYLSLCFLISEYSKYKPSSNLSGQIHDWTSRRTTSSLEDMFDVNLLIQTGGLYILALFLFAEVGLFLGFFLPGDTLLIAAGIFAKQGKMSIAAVLVIAALSAIAGDSTAYLIGRHVGRRIFNREYSVLFNRKHVLKAERFFERYGAKTVSVTHFIPIVRTFTPLVAGVAKLTYPLFLAFDAIGDIAWSVVVGLLGYYVGSRIPGIDNYILLVIGAAVILSLAPTIVHLVRWRIRKHP